MKGHVKMGSGFITEVRGKGEVGVKHFEINKIHKVIYVPRLNLNFSRIGQFLSEG